MPNKITRMSVTFAHTLSTHQIDVLVQQWLHDDMPSFDVGGHVVGSESRQAVLWMKSAGVVAGIPFVEAVFRILDCYVEWTLPEGSSEGVYIDPKHSGDDKGKTPIATITGSAHHILRGERTALNILSRCSGVATAAYAAVRQAKLCGWNGSVAGTRKTTPGFRLVEKYGLLVGGAATHRLDVSQMVMLKDNHIWSTGSISTAVTVARQAAGFSSKIEVECQSLEDAIEAANAGCDIVMLDNMSAQQLKHDSALFKAQFPHVLVEASGQITLHNMAEYMSDHVDIISQGSLTQGYACIDYSLKIQK
jgi:nicotinate-nucleotide pyrophosphorylase (carboxylating)